MIFLLAGMSVKRFATWQQMALCTSSQLLPRRHIFNMRNPVIKLYNFIHTFNHYNSLKRIFAAMIAYRYISAHGKIIFPF